MFCNLGKSISLSLGSRLCGCLRRSPLFDFFLDASQFLHLSQVLLLFDDLEDVVVWLSRFLILISVVLNCLTLDVEVLLETAHVDPVCFLLVTRWLLLPCDSYSIFKGKVIFSISLAFVKDFFRFTLHVVVDYELFFFLVCQVLFMQHVLNSLAVGNPLHRVVVRYSFEGGLVFH